ncbi:hypothetical protein JYU34_012557 [Plutella xylostella]|uniref:Uncharacterized protein n=1 Tax=Plutella xylostella TaxID=51655 RepID=A0ABQ7QCK6_PLUXY|nr:hypothetical protein JYU34_012557 [Plutella xylostella]
MPESWRPLRPQMPPPPGDIDGSGCLGPVSRYLRRRTRPPRAFLSPPSPPHVNKHTCSLVHYESHLHNQRAHTEGR